MAHAEVPQLALEIEHLLGAARMRRPRGLEQAVAEVVVEPASVDEISELVKKCEADGISLAPIAACRTLSALRSRPVQIGVSCAGLNSIVDYQPDDMTVIVSSGVTLADLNRHCSSRGQHLPIDPTGPDKTTIGSLIGGAKCGPLSMSEGAAKDLLIGIQFVGHGGRIVRGGGRVVKNVAGYDFMKLMTGSQGTLGIMTEAAFKMRPMPEHYSLARASFASPSDAFEIGARIEETVPAWHLEILSPRAASELSGESKFAVAAGFCGNETEIEYQLGRVKGLWNVVVERDARAFDTYRRLRDIRLKCDLAIEIAAPPAEIAPFLLEASDDHDFEFCCHPAAGRASIWIGNRDGQTDFLSMTSRWREKVRARRGHLNILSMPADLRGRIEAFDQPNPAELKLMRRLKHSFDPCNIFNPGFFVGGV